MKNFLASFASLILFSCTIQSQSPPWLSPLRIATSSDGVTFSASTIFQDSAGVASVMKISGDTMIAAFQWFPMPFQNTTSWDKIAVKFSYDGGINWTTPTTCVFTGIPGGYQRPWDPALMKMPNGDIRMYFSEGPNNPATGQVDTWSAVSNDGINYTVDAGVRYDEATHNVIDPAVAYYNGSYYYNAWTGINSEGAYRGTSTDALTFNTTAAVPYDGTHTWLGNYMKDGAYIKFYGTGNGNIWYNTTTDMSTWFGFTNTNVMGADPAVVLNNSYTYVMIYTGQPSASGIGETDPASVHISVYPTLASSFFTIQLGEFSADINYSLQLMNANGQLVSETALSSSQTEIDVQDLAQGMYFYTILGNGEFLKRGKIVIQK